jgi:ribonuclease HII
MGFARIAGVDEAGRGSLAGPVVAAAVVLSPRRLVGLRDSKLLTGAARERLYDRITDSCLAWGVGEQGPEEIDRLNVHRASLAAMHDALRGLTPLPDFVLVDAFRVPSLFIPQRGVVGGDRQCACIAAASIVAKVTRDREMVRLHQVDDRYGFDRHKGYATREHLAAVARYGYSPAHRRTFRPSSLSDTIG